MTRQTIQNKSNPANQINQDEARVPTRDALTSTLFLGIATDQKRLTGSRTHSHTEIDAVMVPLTYDAPLSICCPGTWVSLTVKDIVLIV